MRMIRAADDFMDIRYQRAVHMVCLRALSHGVLAEMAHFA